MLLFFREKRQFLKFSQSFVCYQNFAPTKQTQLRHDFVVFTKFLTDIRFRTVHGSQNYMFFQQKHKFSMFYVFFFKSEGVVRKYNTISERRKNVLTV